MTHNSGRFKRCLLGVLAVWIAMLLVATLLATPEEGWAAPGETMPPRPPTATPRSPATATPVGAAIILRTQPERAPGPADVGEFWIVVQWLGGDGVWHDVEGWQGKLDRSGAIRWWVVPFNNSRRDFRWVVYSNQQRDAIAAISSSFALPKQPGQVSIQTVSLSPPERSTPTPP